MARAFDLRPETRGRGSARRGADDAGAPASEASTGDDATAAPSATPPSDPYPDAALAPADGDLLDRRFDVPDRTSSGWDRPTAAPASSPSTPTAEGKLSGAGRWTARQSSTPTRSTRGDRPVRRGTASPKVAVRCGDDRRLACGSVDPAHVEAKQHAHGDGHAVVTDALFGVDTDAWPPAHPPPRHDHHRRSPRRPPRRERRAGRAAGLPHAARPHRAASGAAGTRPEPNWSHEEYLAARSRSGQRIGRSPRGNWAAVAPGETEGLLGSTVEQKAAQAGHSMTPVVRVRSIRGSSSTAWREPGLRDTPCPSGAGARRSPTIRALDR